MCRNMKYVKSFLIASISVFIAFALVGFGIIFTFDPQESFETLYALGPLEFYHYKSNPGESFSFEGRPGIFIGSFLAGILNTIYNYIKDTRR